jgi:hypothetical protein
MDTVRSRIGLDKSDFLDKGVVLNTSPLDMPTDLVHCNIKIHLSSSYLIGVLVTVWRLRQDGSGLRCGARSDKRVTPECAIATLP